MSRLRRTLSGRGIFALGAWGVYLAAFAPLHHVMGQGEEDVGRHRDYLGEAARGLGQAKRTSTSGGKRDG